MKWLFLVHQVQTRNSRERVKIWRLTKKVGAVLHRNSVYVLPYGRERLGDFHWLCQQIRDSSGDASVFVSESTDESEDLAIKALFNSSREADYTALLTSVESLRKRIRNVRGEKRLSEDVWRALSKELAESEKAW